MNAGLMNSVPAFWLHTHMSRQTSQFSPPTPGLQ